MQDRIFRALRSVCTANLVLATALVGSYILYGLSLGLPIDRYFLGLSGRWGLGHGTGPKFPAWAFSGVFGIAILITLAVGRYAGWNMGRHRFFCGVFGFVFLAALLVHLPHRAIFPEDEASPSAPAGIPSFDHLLAFYVWFSYLAYALIGPNKK